MKYIFSVALLGGALLWSPATAHGLSPYKCEASKLGAAGKYDFCRLKVEAKAAKTGAVPDFSKCDTSYSTKWTRAETGASGMCPSNGDEAAVQAFITEETDALKAALDGSILPQGVETCNGNLAATQASLSICNGNLSTCNSNSASCSSNLGTCNSNLASCNSNLAATQASLGICNGNLTTCISNSASCSSSLGTCTGGTAAQLDVLSGKTFSSSSGLGLMGTMPNNGAVNITPGTTGQPIAAGFHNGSGTVAGDTNLASGNIRQGVSIFGVSGTLSPSACSGSVVLQTGQTTSYDTGSDGDLRKGATRSYTDNGDGTITDNTTGLMWEKKSRDGTIHDYANTYTWGMVSPPYTMNGTMVETFLAALNAGGGFAGHTDWRIPNVNELQTIANYQNVGPAVDAVFNTGCAASCTVTSCSCTRADNYWSSTTYLLGGPDFAWDVFFLTGQVSAEAKSGNFYVRAVRGGS